jgi:CheY-like chemotaxis protein
VEVAHDGEAGLRAAVDVSPDLVFLDIRLPKLDGVEVLRRLMQDDATRGIPVVMLSNYDDPELIRSSRDLGAKDYLVKVNTNPTELPTIAARWIAQA